MKRRLLCFAIIISLLFATANVSSKIQAQTNPQTAATPQNLHDWEQIFLSVPTPESARQHLRIYTEEPHMAGTEADYQTAVYTRDRLKEYGITAEIVEYQVLLPYPKEFSLEMTAPTKFKASLKEDSVDEDKDSFDQNATPLFNAYSASGQVSGQLVYVNYGLPADYQKLAELGINVKDKIAIARYGRSFRGVKAKVAEQHGAKGLIIYSDPADDGYGVGDTYPKGPYRSASSAQRGSILYTFQYAGDPLTPGVAATKDAQRLPLDKAESLPKIVVQPISYRDAAPLLEALGGPNVPRTWQGMLPFAYHLGPGPTEVKLQVNLDYQVRKIWNVIGEIKGATEPEKLVVLGNHRDAWVYGAVDPNSGSATMLEVGKGLGEMLKRGWRPDRTIILGSWDAEEFGLIGSTEWVEEHANELSQNAVAYINVDVAVNGPNFNISGVPSLAAFARSVMADVIDPKTGQTVLATWSKLPGNRRPDGSSEIQLGSLGSGSDFTPFLQHIGVPSIDMGFNGPYGVYHSIYDSFHWMEKFGDPNFSYHTALAKVWGLMAIRLASQPTLPFDYANYAGQIEKFIESINRDAQTNKVSVDLSELKQAANQFHQAADRYQEKLRQIPANSKNIKLLNEKGMAVERAFIAPEGLPLRPWYRHIIYAPGYYAGYDAEALSGLQQAIDEKDGLRAKQAANQVKQALERAKEILLIAASS